MRTGAINISAATVTFSNNEFEHLHHGSIVLDLWNHIAIDHNLFVNLENDAIKAEVGAANASNFEFSFTGNHIHKASPGSLRFAAISQSVNSARVGNNYFKEQCSCNLENWIRQMTGRNSSVSWMMDSSYCMVDKLLDRCFNLPEGYMPMGNFTKLICAQRHHVVNCEKPSPKPEPSVSPPSVGPHIYPKQKGFFDMEMNESEQLEHAKRIIVIVFVVAVFIVLVVILTAGILYMRRRGVCPKLTSYPLMTLTNWFSSSNGVTAATSARSISRLSVSEYAGLQPETRILDVEPQAETTEDDDENDFYSYTENKATQTLPEELTEEYLQDLRERLNDPNNYSQARDMIEHLYDLIKVEESCNNNNDRQPASDREENAYDVIRPIRRPRGTIRPSVTVGTKAPSLEKLLPSGIQARPLITEYAEPRDQRTNDQNHLYAELPGDETMPSTSRLSQPILESLIGRAPQPLPPDVVNDHLVNGSDRVSRNYCYDDFKSPQSSRPDSTDKNQPGRPINFFKVLGETILGSKISNKRPNSLLCEYAEPSDAAAHLYLELPEVQQTSATTSKMANRPLPTKPDQDSVAANATTA